ncbi:MAG TPA: hypothetical protein VGM92_09495 [Candidatus Kapabacteria bacterium]|jgi:hypothetical protein
MTQLEVKTIGEFLRFYQTDLEYIANFRRFLNGTISPEKYIEETPGSFYRFLIEFRIIRNLEKDQTKELLQLTKRWCLAKNCDDVDKFALKIKETGLSHGKTPRSLASKIIFLNNPWNILPIDARGRQTLHQKSKCYYNDYRLAAKQFVMKEKESLASMLKEITPFLSEIESTVTPVLPRIEVIRENRLIDKLLWVKGDPDDLIP